MGSLMIGFSVPVFARSRQLRMRDEMAAMERMAEADLAMEQADTDARLIELIAEIERASDLIELYRSEILPQADANVESAFASYRSGGVDFMTLIDARMSANDYEQEYHVLLAEYGIAIVELEMAIGRELTPTRATDGEAR
jgi:outer membrane protein TolC